MASEPRNFALIIGAMKSGTTSLFHYLAEHPEIAPCSRKEPQFFVWDERWAHGMDWYRNLWNWRPAQHTIALEASTHYTNLPAEPHVAERIAEADDAQFRFIYIMRHPLDRLESHYSMVKARGLRTQPSDQGVPQQAISISQYAMQLDAYQRFGRDRMLLLFTDDLKKDPRRVVQTVCRFVGVDPDYNFKSLDRVHNTRDGYFWKLPKFWSSLRRIGPMERVVNSLPGKVRKRLRSRLVRRVAVDESKYRLTPEQRERFAELLRPDLQRLQSEYGVDVESRWGIPLVADQASQPPG